MPGDEVEVPKELREFMLDEDEETFLGQQNGACNQYRYGNLHIREYDDKFLVRTDKIDPRKDPIGHLVYDAPEFLAGLACAVFSGSKITKKFLNKNSSLTSVLPSSIISGYLGYTTTKKLKIIWSKLNGYC